jgi:hypothetical protein
MWGRKAADIQTQQATITRLTERISALEDDPLLALARDLRREVAEQIDSVEIGARDDSAITAIIERKRQALLAQAAEALAASKLAQLTIEAKAEMQRQATVSADKLAAEALRRFYESGEAEAYRHKVQADLTTARASEVLALARAEIDTEELQRHTAREKAGLLRLEAIRATTRYSGVLDLGLLERDDNLTLGFGGSGNGILPIYKQQWTTPARNEAVYQTDDEYRRISFVLTDGPPNLTFEVLEDAWFEHPDPKKNEQAVLGGMLVHLTALNPLTITDKEEPVVVRNDPIHMLTPEGDVLAEIDRPIWWATLNDNFVLADASTPGFRLAY